MTPKLTHTSPRMGSDLADTKSNEDNKDNSKKINENIEILSRIIQVSLQSDMQSPIHAEEESVLSNQVLFP